MTSELLHRKAWIISYISGRGEAGNAFYLLPFFAQISEVLLVDRTSLLGLVCAAPHQGREALRWGEAVKAGDLLKIQYELPMTGPPEVTLPRLSEKRQGGTRPGKSGADE